MTGGKITLSAEVDVAIIGAGIVGLAVASEIARQKAGVFVFEKNHTFGLETSSRNSEVIHSGIYYPEDSLKARLCIEGKGLLYELCEQHGIGYKKLGKIIVAAEEDEVKQLEKLYQQGEKNGVKDLTFLSRTELKTLEPKIEGRAGLLSPSTGIVDSHALLKFFYGQASERGVKFVFNSEVVGVEKAGDKYRIQIKDREGISTFVAYMVINAAGLNSDRIARMSGINVAQAGYQLHYCKGEYFSLSPKWRNAVSRLVYPAPEQAGLGIHLTTTLDGKMRLGPNARYVDIVDYKVDDSQKRVFYRAAKKFLPYVEFEDLEPEFAGIRPKLQAPGEAFRDFVIAHEYRAGFPGLINLIGIESPGLTASPSVAKYVAKIVAQLSG